jgi:hypothetical protein
VRGEGARRARRSVGVDTRGGVILRSLKKTARAARRSERRGQQRVGRGVRGWKPGALALGGPRLRAALEGEINITVLQVRRERQVLARHYRSDVTSPRSTSMIDRTSTDASALRWQELGDFSGTGSVQHALILGFLYSPEI